MTKLPDRDHYHHLLATGLQLLTGAGSLDAAMGQIFPEGAVGMKTNCLTSRVTSTPVDLTLALGDLLIDNGFAENDIVVWERSNRELKRAGYELNASFHGRRCLGTDTVDVGYSDDFFSYKLVNSRVSRVLTDIVTSNVNVPVLKDHSMAGLSGALKNLYGVIHNPNKYHANNCSPFAGQVGGLEPVKRTDKLTIIDATRVQWDKGPGPSPNHLAYFGGLIIAQDAVAADTIALQVLEHYRALNGAPPLAKAGREVKYLKEAAANGLGVADPAQIELQVLVVDIKGNVTKSELFA